MNRRCFTSVRASVAVRNPRNQLSLEQYRTLVCPWSRTRISPVPKHTTITPVIGVRNRSTWGRAPPGRSIWRIRMNTSWHKPGCRWVNSNEDPRKTPRDEDCPACQEQVGKPWELSTRELMWEKRLKLMRNYIERDPYDALFGSSNSRLKGLWENRLHALRKWVDDEIGLNAYVDESKDHANRTDKKPRETSKSNSEPARSTSSSTSYVKPTSSFKENSGSTTKDSRTEGAQNSSSDSVATNWSINSYYNDSSGKRLQYHKDPDTLSWSYSHINDKGRLVKHDGERVYDPISQRMVPAETKQTSTHETSERANGEQHKSVEIPIRTSGNTEASQSKATPGIQEKSQTSPEPAAITERSDCRVPANKTQPNFSVIERVERELAVVQKHLRSLVKYYAALSNQGHPFSKSTFINPQSETVRSGLGSTTFVKEGSKAIGEDVVERKDTTLAPIRSELENDLLQKLKTQDVVCVSSKLIEKIPVTAKKVVVALDKIRYHPNRSCYPPEKAHGPHFRQTPRSAHDAFDWTYQSYTRIGRRIRPLKHMTSMELHAHRKALLRSWKYKQLGHSLPTPIGDILRREIEKHKNVMNDFDNKAIASRNQLNFEIPTPSTEAYFKSGSHKLKKPVTASIGAEGDLSRNVADFTQSDRWYKKKAPHAILEEEKRQDEELVRNIKRVYEETYGSISAGRRQGPVKQKEAASTNNHAFTEHGNTDKNKHNLDSMYLKHPDRGVPKRINPLKYGTELAADSTLNSRSNAPDSTLKNIEHGSPKHPKHSRHHRVKKQEHVFSGTRGHKQRSTRMRRLCKFFLWTTGIAAFCYGIGYVIERLEEISAEHTPVNKEVERGQKSRKGASSSRRNAPSLGKKEDSGDVTLVTTSDLVVAASAGIAVAGFLTLILKEIFLN